ncbi:reverse transcriptase family protein [Planctomicrobium sp. SH668]|uniref:reverse transcriptase family protein n=1 Tax=Planctomicrobium sp. SH668 TaxID=3448126 RepID=UPI003F5C6456
MGLFDFFWRLFGGGNRVAESAREARQETTPSVSLGAVSEKQPPFQTAPEHVTAESAVTPQKQSQATPNPLPHPTHCVELKPLRYQSSLIPTDSRLELVRGRPYAFATATSNPGEYLNLSKDTDLRWIEYFGIPKLQTPEQIADWLGISLGKLAWLTHRTERRHRADSAKKSHYHYQWIQKRSGGWRLIEAPKAELKQAQSKILREILDRIPPHTAAHGFVADRSILTNARPHVGKRFILKMDLKDFYSNVRYSRVVAIFRSLGYSREVAIWLASLCTSNLPWDVKSPVSDLEKLRYYARHLPQGGVTSPALANLSAFSLDVRLSGLAEAYHLNYTRYADDLTFSGPGKAIPALHELIPMIRQIIGSERFIANRKKFRIIRNGQRQTVTGLVVNDQLNISRTDYDRLKATLHNCVQQGPSTQNRKNHPNFRDHLLGRITHVLNVSTNAARGEKLLNLYYAIDWSK